MTDPPVKMVLSTCYRPAAYMHQFFIPLDPEEKNVGYNMLKEKFILALSKDELPLHL